MTLENVYLLRLTSGEEIIAQVFANETSHIIGSRVFNPVLLIRTGESSISFMEWMPYADKTDGIVLPENSILFEAIPNEDFSKKYNQYVQRTKSTLELPDEPKLVL